MAQISFALPYNSKWIEGIYRLEVTDRTIGYNSATGVEGVANKQWQELSDRTNYLKKLLDKAHKEGHHSLTYKDFLPTTKIPESKLSLAHSTADLNDRLLSIDRGKQSSIEALDNLTDVNASYTSILTVLMPYSREYFKTYTDYELFTNVVKLRGFGSTVIRKEVAGDDSLDVDNSDGVEPGSTYFLMDKDGKHVEEVVVLSVLTKNRIRLTKNCKYTRSYGFMACTTLVPEEGIASITGPFAYVTSTIDVLEGSEYGKLFIHRDNVAATGKVLYCIDGTKVWNEAELIGSDNFFDGTIDDIYRLPAAKLKLRIEYQANTNSYNLHYFVVKAIHHYIAAEDIQQPTIITVREDKTTKKVTINASKYRSLWSLAQKNIEARIIKNTQTLVYTTGTGTSVTISLPNTERPLQLQVRYTDIEGTHSRWSQSYIME